LAFILKNPKNKKEKQL